METEKIIFFRNFLFRTFLIGVLFGILYGVVTMAFWDTWVRWVESMFKIDEKVFGKLAVSFFTLVRIVLVFFFLAPTLALHWMIKSKR